MGDSLESRTRRTTLLPAAPGPLPDHSRRVAPSDSVVRLEYAAYAEDRPTLRRNPGLDGGALPWDPSGIGRGRPEEALSPGIPPKR